MITSYMFRIASNWRYMLPLVTLVIFTSCTSKNDVTLNSQKYSGEELLEGIFFFKGPVASQLPETDERLELRKVLIDAQQQEEFGNVQAKIFQQIKLSNPTFFNEFKSKVTSGNHLLIEDALKDAGKVIYAATQKIYNFDESTLGNNSKEASEAYTITLSQNGNSNKTKQQREKLALSKFVSTKVSNDKVNDKAEASIIVGPVAIAVAAVVAAVVTIAWVISDSYIQNESNSIINPADEDDFFKEKLINSIATQLVEE